MNEDDLRRLKLLPRPHREPSKPLDSPHPTREREILFDGLAGLMERLPTSSVRLIIFNLEQQEELLRRENFTVSQLDSVARTLKDLELGSVRVGILEKSKGHVDLITRLLNTEIRSSSPSDAVVILGPEERYFEKVPDGALETPRGNKPLFFAVQFVPAPRLVSNSTPTDVGGVRDPRTAHPSTALRTVLITPGNFDTISNVIRRLKGKAIQVSTPDQFERAIEDIEPSRLRRH